MELKHGSVHGSQSQDEFSAPLNLQNVFFYCDQQLSPCFLYVLFFFKFVVLVFEKYCCRVIWMSKHLHLAGLHIVKRRRCLFEKDTYFSH